MEGFMVMAALSGVALIVTLFCRDRSSPGVSSATGTGYELKAGDRMPQVTLCRLLTLV
jgi:hypothetical protein